MNNNILILLSNNGANDPFLYSQLLNIYSDTPQFTEKYIFCKGMSEDINEEFVIVDTNQRKYYWNYARKLYVLLKDNKDNKIIIHLRGFVSASIFFAVSLLFRRKFAYIYDPRGAFIIEKKESNSPLAHFSILLEKIELYLIKNSLGTIVTSEKFKTLFTEIYGYSEKYIVCYNASSLTPVNIKSSENIKDKEVINICYVGSVNYWHDIDEILRVFKHLSEIIPNKKVINHFFTQKINHGLVKKKFKENSLDSIIDFVHYSNLEGKLKDMDICLSIVKPTASTKIASPIKISDYVLLNKIMILNEGIGDSDTHFGSNNSAILYKYGEPMTFSYQDIKSIQVEKNSVLLEIFRLEANVKKIKTLLMRFENLNLG